jgi:hypothetical protein
MLRCLREVNVDSNTVRSLRNLGIHSFIAVFASVAFSRIFLRSFACTCRRVTSLGMCDTCR